MIWTIFRYEFIRNGLRRPYLFFTIGLPLLAVVGVFLYQAFDTTTGEDDTDVDISFANIHPVGFIDYSNSFDAPAIGPLAGKVIAYPDESAAQEAVRSDEIHAYYVIAQEYMATGAVRRYVEKFSLNFDDIEMFRAFLLSQLLQSQEDALIYSRFQNTVNLQINQVKAEGGVETRDEDTDFTRVYVFAMPFLLTVFSASRYLMQSVVEERETRMVEILASSVRPFPLLAAKILAMGSLGLIQMVTLLGAALWSMTRLADTGLTLQSIGTDTILINFLYFIGGYLFLGSLFAGIGAISNNMQEGPQLVTLFTLPAVAPLWITVLFATDPNGTIPTLLSLFPLTAPLSMIMRTAVTTVPIWQLIVSLGLLFISILGAIWFASRLYRLKILLTGTRPSIREIPRLLFQA